MALFSVTEPVMPSGPPPQSVLDQRPFWHVLMLLLAAAFVLRLIALDIIGSVLMVLMLCMAVLIIRDGMYDMSKYVLIYAVLCSLCFLFDVVPLLSSLGGRTQVSVDKVRQNSNGEFKQVVYRQTLMTHPFFDKNLGLSYNAASAAMILAPVAMLLGTYLSVKAHCYIQRETALLFEDSPSEYWDEPPSYGTAQNGVFAGVASHFRSSSGGFNRFQGQSYKLSDK
mmetsp:Transcript_80436/g.139604  ORF Transcript_80436/g.139604 Transcript_80436/m.139604 type:complete len:225 (-) Transcript_80436:86-760(-)